MPSTYTTNGGIQKIGTGEQSGTWGNTTNTNFDIIDRITNGVGTIDLSGSAGAHTLQTTDGVLSDGMYSVLVLTGATQACTITVAPNDAQKVYFVRNTSGYNAIFTQGSGSNVTIANGDSAIIYCDGGGSGASVIELSAAFKVDYGDWTISESGGSLYFATSGVNKMKLDASGNLDVVGNVNTNATIS